MKKRIVIHIIAHLTTRSVYAAFATRLTTSSLVTTTARSLQQQQQQQPASSPHTVKKPKNNIQEINNTESQPSPTTILSMTSSSSSSSSTSLSSSTTTTTSVRQPPSKIKLLGMTLTPHALSVLSMTFAMALHFFGYEYARSASLSLFTSSQSGFTSQAAYPLAMAAVSPFSLLLLFFYGKELDRCGPRHTLKRTSLFCSAALILSAILLQNATSSSLLSKIVISIAFVFQNCYATLLYSQHFSFMGSVMTESQGAKWFAIIAGVSSISSTIAGASLPFFIPNVGVMGLFCIAGMSLILSAVFGDKAYEISDEYGFGPEPTRKKTATMQHQPSCHGNIFERASNLFRRVPTLGALFGEVLSFYALTTILNTCFVTKLRDAIPDDALRAAYMGKFFAMINGTCGVLQFAILPFLLKRLNASWMWRIMPLILCSITGIQCLSVTPSLFWISASFFAVKVMDYSSRATVNELVYVPLDYESRFVGKEVIGMFGNGIGKSGMSIVLAGLTTMFGVGLSKLSLLSSVASVTWLACAFRLSHLLPKGIKEETTKKSE